MVQPDMTEILLTGTLSINTNKQNIASVESSTLILHDTLCDLLFYSADSLTSKSFTIRTKQLSTCSVPLRKLRARLGFR